MRWYSRGAQAVLALVVLATGAFCYLQYNEIITEREDSRALVSSAITNHKSVNKGSEGFYPKMVSIPVLNRKFYLQAGRYNESLQRWPVAKNGVVVADFTTFGDIATNSHYTLYAHNRDGLFETIHTLREGDKIILSSDLSEQIYTVRYSKKIEKEDIASVKQAQIAGVALLSCTGMFDSHRYLVSAAPEAPLVTDNKL